MYLRAIAVAGLVLLGACSDPDVKEPTPKPTASASPSLAPPTMPAQAKEDSSEGAAAFVSYWVDVFNYATQTGDVRPLQRASSETCSGCQRYINKIRQTYAAGGHYRGGAWTLSDLQVTSSASIRTVFVRVKSKPGGTFKSAADAPEESSAPVDQDLIFDVDRGRTVRSLSRSS